MPFWSVSTLMFARLFRCSAASFDLIFVVMAESLTNVAGFARSWSLLLSSAYAATGASIEPTTKQAVASLYFIGSPVVDRDRACYALPGGVYVGAGPFVL